MQTTKDMFWLPSAAVLLGGTAIPVYASLTPLLKGRPLGLLPSLLCDSVFTGAAVLFLLCGLRYGKQRHPEGIAPYSGAWLDAAGNQRLPSGFAPHYLLFAFLASFATPAAAMLLCLLLGHGTLAVGLLAGYQATFVVQMMLETKLFHRNFMSPSIPFTFAPYRFWQLARALWSLHLQHAPVGGWLASVLTAVLAFWIFDYGVTSVQLPWVLNWQLQQAGKGAAAVAEQKEE